MTALNEPLRLPHGASLPNRIAKAAMEELLAAPGQVPGDRLFALYRRWAAGGAGLLITGHVMIDGTAVAQPGDVVLERGTPLEPFRHWAAAGRSAGGRIWMQLNHPGRVVPKDLADITWGPSAVPIDAGGFSRMYPTPRPMSARQIEETVERFAVTALRARQAGFDGVQIHAAHGYLLSQFLSPLVNRREDRWGGSLHHRARFLLDVVGTVRERVGTGFAVGVKLNSADFQRGGFDTADAGEVITLLVGAGADLVELSGGSIESLATAGSPADGRTLAREAYFLDLAERLTATSPLPLLLTGGIRRRAVAEQVLDSGIAVVGVATALAIDPTLPRQWLAGGEAHARPPRTRIRNKALAAAAVQAATSRQLARLGAGRAPGAPWPPAALLLERLVRARRRRAYAKWRSTYAGAGGVPDAAGRSCGTRPCSGPCSTNRPSPNRSPDTASRS
ncbi:NADH:flavin oxidoreductase/NADH oxidase family protein [Streptomyces xiamenensis]|uniref:NADH:flavin oxidoreductase/NADH oxidase family protein n=1 Tax=Streptomyces xiamenensis TaxID=408015 RepID=UPI0037CE31E4